MPLLVSRPGASAEPARRSPARVEIGVNPANIVVFRQLNFRQDSRTKSMMPSVARRRKARAGGGGIMALCVGGILACQSGASHQAGAPADAGSVVDPKPIDGVTLPALCSREGEDAVRDIFCKEGSPDIRSLRDLESRLQLALPLEENSGATVGPV